MTENEGANILEELRAKHHRRNGAYVGTDEALAVVREMEHSAQVVHTPSIASAKSDDLDKLALLDGLTELYNFRTFLKELKAELGRAKRYKHPVALAMIAVDNFDLMCSQYGSLTGESVVKVVANVLRTSIREVDIPSRYAAQNFVIIFPQTTASGAALVAERIRQRIGNQAIMHNWQSFSVTASVGVASYPANADAHDELVATTLESLEFAIERGGDRVFCA